jgi:acetolactate synthase-1/3 small subunit
VVDAESAPIEQITKQLFKLISVIKISELNPTEAVERELMLASVRADATTRSHVIELVQVFEGKIVDVGSDTLTLMLAGTPAKLDDFEELIRPFGIVELQRTGRVALPRLERNTPRLRSVTGKVG